MARTYNQATPSYLSTSSIPVAELPVTFCVILQRPTADGTYEFFCEYKAAFTYFQLDCTRASSVMTWRYLVFQSTVRTATCSWSPGTIGSGTWVMIHGVTETATSHKLYVNGTLRSTSTARSNPVVDSGTTYIGSGKTGSKSYTGVIGTVAIWNVAMNASEIAGAFASEVIPANKAFVAPWLRRPESLVACWPCLSGQSPEPNLVGATPSMTLTGSPPKANGDPLGWYGNVPVAA